MSSGTVRPPGSPPTPRPLRERDVAQLVAAVAAGSFLVRLRWPLGSEEFHLQLALFPQYMTLFAFGAAAWRRGWLNGLDPRLRRRCAAATATAVAALPVIVAGGGGLDDGSPVLGGWHWQALAMAVVDSVLACCASLWVLEAFRRHRRRGEPGVFGRSLARNSYGAYIIHPLLVVPLALAVHSVLAPAELKFLVVAPAAVVGSFALAALADRRPWVRRGGRREALGR